MIALFKQKSPGNVAVLFIFGLLIKLPLFLYPKAIAASQNDGHLYQWFISALSDNNKFFGSVLSFALLYVQAMLLNFMVNEYRLMARQNYLPAMAYLLITSLFPEWNYLSSPLVANTFIILMFIFLFKLYNSANIRAQVYNIGIIAGISSYIFFPSLIFIICIFLGLMILKPFRLNEIILFLIGVLTPYYFHFIYLVLTDKLSAGNFLPEVNLSVPDVKDTIWLAASTTLLAVPFFIGGYFIQTHLRKMLIQVRKNWSIMVLYLLLAFLVPFINSDDSFYTWVLITAPFAAFHANAYFYPVKRWLGMILFFATVGYILYLQYGALTWEAINNQ